MKRIMLRTGWGVALLWLAGGCTGRLLTVNVLNGLKEGSIATVTGVIDGFFSGLSATAELAGGDNGNDRFIKL